MAESTGELQDALNALNDYCENGPWQSMQIKKIVVFSRGKVTKLPNFFLGTTEIDVVEEYTYLGVTFNYNGLFRKALNKQITQARKAMFALLAKAKSLKLPIDITCELSEIIVTPVLLYGCEIWGPSDIKDIEIFHRGFLRILLKTFEFTPNCMLYGETGVTNMNTCINSRMINFWAKLKFGDQNKISNHDLVAHESQVSLVDSYLVVNWSWQSYSHNARHTGYYWLVPCINDMWDHLCVFFCIFLMSFILYIAWTGSCITVVVWRGCNRLGQWQCDFHLRAALPLGGVPRRHHIANRGAGPSKIMHCGLAQHRDSTDVGSHSQTTPWAPSRPILHPRAGWLPLRPHSAVPWLAAGRLILF